jgi:hypothetical protein
MTGRANEHWAGRHDASGQALPRRGWRGNPGPSGREGASALPQHSHWAGQAPTAVCTSSSSYLVARTTVALRRAEAGAAVFMLWRVSCILACLMEIQAADDLERWPAHVSRPEMALPHPGARQPRAGARVARGSPMREPQAARMSPRTHRAVPAGRRWEAVPARSGPPALPCAALRSAPSARLGRPQPQLFDRARHTQARQCSPGRQAMWPQGTGVAGRCGVAPHSNLRPVWC